MNLSNHTQRNLIAVFITLILTLFIAAIFTKQYNPSHISVSKPDKRPNIIIILADDMGFSDLGCFGSEIATPNLDRLASQGMIMTNFYNCGRCCPSRASLLTGLYPHQAGVGDMIQPRPYPAYQGYLSEHSVTIAQLLKQSGYHTITSGKWHVGADTSALAYNRGFDKSFTMLNNGSSYFKNGPLYNDGRTVTFMQDRKVIQRDTNYYLTQNITDFAVQAIEAQKNNTNPFFLYLTYTAPHWPIQALEEDIQKYRGTYLTGWDALRTERYQKLIANKIIDLNWPLSARYESVPAWKDIPEEERDLWDMRMSIYAAMIDRMDQGIGEILKKLTETGEDKNTIILFLSDNGGSADEVKQLSYVIQKNGTPGTGDNIDSYYSNWGNVSSTPFRLFKKNVHEGGIASPFIAWYPGMIKPSGMNAAIAHIMDLMPTCLEIAKVRYPETFQGKSLTPLPGLSLVKNFTGKSALANDTLFWEHEGNKAVRTNKWKLVYELDYKKWELYDMIQDRTETNDLSAQHPELVMQLKRAHDAWSKKVGVLDWATIK